jgi:hypothetical protein
MARHRKHDSPDLHDALEHVMYEIWKYKQSIAYFAMIQQVGGDASIEFRVLHHRVLLEFFQGPAKHKDNIVAREYIDSWEQTHDPAKLPWLDDYMTRCHTMLAHISTTRSAIAKSGDKSWGRGWPGVEAHLDRVVVDFLRALSNDYKETCRQWLDKWLAGLHPGKDVLKELTAALA